MSAVSSDAIRITPAMRGIQTFCNGITGTYRITPAMRGIRNKAQGVMLWAGITPAMRGIPFAYSSWTV